MKNLISISLIFSLLYWVNIPYNSSVRYKKSVEDVNELEIQVKYSKHNSILIFLEQLASESDNEFKSIFKNSVYNTSKNINLIKEFNSLDWYFSEGRFKSTRFFKSICIKNDSWKEIRNQAIGLFPDKILYKLIKVLEVFEPIYDSIIYQPSKYKFNEQLSKIKNLVKEKNIGQYFNKAMIFYGSNWNKDVPLIVTFYPIPNAEGFTAKAYGNTTTSGVPVDYDDFNVLLSVIIHEACHLLYYRQNDEISNLINSVFENSKSVSSTYAYHLFDEASATSIANGIVYKELSGNVDKQYGTFTNT